MTTETEESKMPDDGDRPETDASAEESGDEGGSADVEVNSAEFQEVTASGDSKNGNADLNRFQDIKVTVSADLGRAEVPIQTLMDLGEGSVLELNRKIDSPVELVAQGVPLACGEVVVVNGCFAIRVTQVYENKSS